MRYECIKVSEDELCLEYYRIVALREEDIFKIKEWRNAQISILRQKKKLSDFEQQEYFNSVVLPSFKMQEPPLTLFSFLFKDECIGYGGLVHIDWFHKRAEISFLLNTIFNEELEQYKMHFSSFLKIMKLVAFKGLGLHRIFTEVYDIRPYVIEVLEQSGFQYEGRLKEHIHLNGKYIDSICHGLIRPNYVE